MPLNAILVSLTVAALLSLINLGSSVAFNAILSIGVAALLSSYLVSISCVVIMRLKYQPLLSRRWSLGKWSLPLSLIGLAYLSIVFVRALVPIGIPVRLENVNCALAVYGGVAIVASLDYVFFATHTYVAPGTRVAKDL